MAPLSLPPPSGSSYAEQLVSFFFAEDPNILRLEKLLLLLTFVMSNLLGNSLLYVYETHGLVLLGLPAQSKRGVVHSAAGVKRL